MNLVKFIMLCVLITLAAIALVLSGIYISFGWESTKGAFGFIVTMLGIYSFVGLVILIGSRVS